MHRPVLLTRNIGLARRLDVTGLRRSRTAHYFKRQSVRTLLYIHGKLTPPTMIFPNGRLRINIVDFRILSGHLCLTWGLTTSVPIRFVIGPSDFDNNGWFKSGVSIISV